MGKRDIGGSVNPTEASNPAHLFLQCLASRCTVDDDSEQLELAEPARVVRGEGTYVRPGDSPSS